MGGVWEWTSSVLEKHEGFEPMDVYPGYTGKFSILFGGLLYLTGTNLCMFSGLLRRQAQCCPWRELGDASENRR